MTVLWDFKTGENTMLMSAQKMAVKGAIAETRGSWCERLAGLSSGSPGAMPG